MSYRVVVRESQPYREISGKFLLINILADNPSGLDHVDS